MSQAAAAAGRPSDSAVLESAAATLRALVSAEGLDAVTRTALVQTIALLELVARRGEDPSARRREQLVAALESIAANPYLAGVMFDDPYGVAARALVQAIGHEDPHAEELRDVVRPVLIDHLDDDLAAAGPLLDAFRGRLPDA